MRASLSNTVLFTIALSFHRVLLTLSTFLLYNGTTPPSARPGQTEAESGFVHLNGNVRHLSGFTELMRQHAPHIRHLNSFSSISLRHLRAFVKV